jgi:hypothetical protein
MWRDSIKIELRKIGWGAIVWIIMALLRDQ